MKNILLLFCCLFSIATYAQLADSTFDARTWKPPYTLPSPPGWDAERFSVPPGFAPQIQHRGVEDIRFSPGWAKKDSSDYWSYAFLWYLNGLPTINKQSLTTDLQSYYTGLAKVNTDPKKIPAGGLIQAVAKIKKKRTAVGDHHTFSGTVYMTDYMTQQPLTLNCVIHLRRYEAKNKTIVFVELSPQPFKHNVWQSLHKLWTDFSFE